MATYTMQLRVLIEQASQYEQGLSWNEKIEIGRKKLFDFDYPIYDEDFRKPFETNFIKNFYMREIGFETEGLFKFRLETWLNINMPYFNKMFESELIEYDPLINATMTTAHDKTSAKDQTDTRNVNQESSMQGENDSDLDQDTTNNSQASVDDFNRKVEADMPDSRLELTLDDGSGVLEYATKIDEDKNIGTSTSQGDSNTKTKSKDTSNVDSSTTQADNLSSNVDEMEHFIERRVGKVGITSQSDLIRDYRNALLRVEVQIHKEMQELFMMIY